MSYSLMTCTTYTELTCWVCGCHFAVDERMYDARKARGEDLYCPRGCHLALGESEVAKLRKQMAEVERRAEWRAKQAAANRQWAEREARRAVALKGVVTRTKRRIAAGKCPCCHCQFGDLHRHMASAHPGYADA